MNAILVDAGPLPVPVSADSADDKFLAAARKAGVTIIISGDRDLLDVSGWQDIAVLTPRQFADRHLLAG
jgi:predicted nucleic acid-binding protein